MNTCIHILHLEDNAYDTELVQATLQSAAMALRESEARYRRITEAITDYLYMVRVEDGHAVETRHGPGCLAVTGYSTEEFAADPNLWIRMVVDADRPVVQDQARRVLAGEPAPAIEHRIICKDGAVRWVCNTPVPRRDGQGVLQSYDGLIQDITGRKQAQEALRESEHLLADIAANYPHSYLSIIEKDFTIGFTSGQEFTKQHLDPRSFEKLSGVLLPITPSPHLLFEIEDTGIGISDEQMQAIFEPFTRGDSRPTEGIGLGLAICRRLVELMGGRLSVTSEVGKGSTFTVELELEVAEAGEGEANAPENAIMGYQGERKRLLIVDDHITNLAMLVSTLEPLGFAIETANSGEEALHKAAATRPDLILLDLLMSGMDGDEVLRQIRQDVNLREIKVIGVSAAVADKARVTAFAAACDAFLAKPVDIGELLETLHDQLQLD